MKKMLMLSILVDSWICRLTLWLHLVFYNQLG